MKNKGWIYLLLAGLSEIVWAFGLKHADGFSDPKWSIFTIIVIFISFFLFSYSLRSIPMGTAYAIFTGIGTAGTAIIGIFFMNESADFLKLLPLTILILGIIGLKVVDRKDKIKDHD